MLWIGLLLVMLGVPLLLVVLPVRIRLCGRSGEAEGVRLVGGIGLMAGLVGVRLVHADGGARAAPTLFGVGLWQFDVASGGGKTVPARASKPKRRRGTGEEGKGPRPWRLRARRLRLQAARVRMLAERLRRPLLRFLRRAVRAFRFRRLEGRVVFGLGDPEATGRAYGYWMAVRRLMPRRIDLDVRPDFGRSAVSGHLDLRVSLYPALLIWAGVAFAARLARFWLKEDRAFRRGLRRAERAEAAGSAAA